MLLSLITPTVSPAFNVESVRSFASLSFSTRWNAVAVVLSKFVTAKSLLAVASIWIISVFVIVPEVTGLNDVIPDKASVSVPSPPSTVSFELNVAANVILSLPLPPVNAMFSASAPTVKALPPVLSERSIVPVTTEPTAVPAKSSAFVIVSFDSPARVTFVNVEAVVASSTVNVPIV